MYQYRLYKTEDIDKIKRDLEVYKHTFDVINSEDSKTFLKSQRELILLKRKFSKLKGEMIAMENSYQRQIDNYEKQEQKISGEIRTINHSINQLKKDISLIKGRVNELRTSDLVQKMDLVLHKTDEELAKVKKQLAEQREAYQKAIEQRQKNSGIQSKATNQKSEYRRLQQMLKTIHQPTPSSTQLPQNHHTNTNSAVPSNSSSVEKNNRRGTITISKGKKTFRTREFELNKVIITNTKTAKSNEKEEMQKVENPVKEELKQEEIQPNVNVKRENEALLEQEEITVEASNQESTFSDLEATNSPTLVEHKIGEPEKDITNESSELEPNHEGVDEEAVEKPSGLKKTWLLAKSLWKKT